MIQILLKLWLTGNRTSCHPFRSVIILVIKQIGLLHHSYDYRPNWTLLSPVTITNSLICTPYPRVNCLKTIPFTAAHTCIAHIWQYPPPGAFTSDDFFFSPFPICVRPTIPIMFFSCVQQLEKGDFLVAKMRDKIQSAGWVFLWRKYFSLGLV